MSAEQQQQEEKKDGGQGNEQINIKVVGSDGSEVFFKVKKSTTFDKIFKAYGDRVGRAPSNFRFMYDGDFITGDSTPAKVCLFFLFLVQVSNMCLECASSWIWKIMIQLKFYSSKLEVISNVDEYY